MEPEEAEEGSYFLVSRGWVRIGRSRPEPTGTETDSSVLPLTLVKGPQILRAEAAVGSALTLDTDFDVPRPRGTSAAISPDATYARKWKSSGVSPKKDNILS